MIITNKVKAYWNKLRNFVTGYYDAGRRDIPSVKSWQPRLLTADEEYIKDYDLIRARSRDLVRNNHHGRAVINRFVNSVIGRGLRVQPAIQYKQLGISREEAIQWQEETEAKFHLWAKSKECDHRKKLNFYKLQSLAYRQMLRDGDVFLMLPVKKTKGSPFGIKIKLINSIHIASPLNVQTENIKSGVETDKDETPIAYHFKQSDGTFKRIPAKGEHSGRVNIAHLYEPEDAEQTRGLPILYPVIILIKDMATYLKAELQASVINSLFSVVLKDEEDHGIGGIVNRDDPLNDQDLRNFKLGPGNVLKLPKNKSFEVINAARPTSNFGGYIDSISNAIALGTDMPHEVFLKKFMSSYSAARAALLDFKQNKEIKREQFKHDFCDLVYRSWLYERVLLGDIQADGFLYDAEIRAYYANANWIGDSDGQIDEIKEINAIEKRLNLGLSTHEKEAAQLNGTRFSENVETLKREQEILNEVNKLREASNETTANSSL